MQTHQTSTESSETREQNRDPKPMKTEKPRNGSETIDNKSIRKKKKRIRKRSDRSPNYPKSAIGNEEESIGSSTWRTFRVSRRTTRRDQHQTKQKKWNRRAAARYVPAKNQRSVVEQSIWRRSHEDLGREIEEEWIRGRNPRRRRKGREREESVEEGEKRL